MRRLLAIAALAFANEEDSQLQSHKQYAEPLEYRHVRTGEYLPDEAYILGPAAAPAIVEHRPWLHPYKEGYVDVEIEPKLYPIRDGTAREAVINEPWTHPFRERVIREAPLLRDGEFVRDGAYIREPVVDTIAEDVVRRGDVLGPDNYILRNGFREQWRGPLETNGAIVVEPSPYLDTIADTYEPIVYTDTIARPAPVLEVKQYPVWNKKPHKFTDFYCPKPGYAMTFNNECCREVRLDSRLECPYGFVFDGSGCFKYYDPTVYCLRGQLFEGSCKVIKTVEPVFECPDNTEIDLEGNCVTFEEFTPVEVCPPSTIRSKNGCLAVEYTEPALVCPPDTVPDGKKCRREIVQVKMKKGRLLNAEEEDIDLVGEAHEIEEVELSPEELEAMSKEAIAFDELYADVAITPVVECDSIDCFEEWIPATSEFKIKTKKVKQPIVSEQLKWEKIKIPVTTAKVKDVRVKVPEVKVKVPKEKVVKSPHEVVKVVTQAAEKVCPIGAKHGSTCVAENIVPPILECPHPHLGPDCIRRIVVPPLAICTRGELVCDGFGCRCELAKFFPAEVTCLGGHQLINGRCVMESEWQRMCPIGYFLEGDGVTCAKTDCEPPLTVVAKQVSPKKKLPKKLMDLDDDKDEMDFDE